MPIDMGRDEDSLVERGWCGTKLGYRFGVCVVG